MMPGSYRYWSDCLDRFAAGDDSVLGDLGSADLAWQPGVAERVTARISEAFHARLREIQRRLQRDLQTVGGDLGNIGQALVHAKRALSPLLGLSQLATLPDEVRQHLREELVRIVEEIQDALERSVRPDTDGDVRVLAELRHHRLTAVFGQVSGTPVIPEQARASRPRPLIF